MAQDLAVGDIIETVAYCRAINQNGLNVRHWQITERNGTGRTDQQLCDAMEQNYAPLYKDYLSVQASWVGMTLKVIRPTQFLKVQSTASAGAGVSAGDLLPPAVSGLIKLNTNLAGRRFRGRIYLPFAAEEDNTLLGSVSNATQALFDAIGAAYTSPFTAAAGANSVFIRPMLYRRSTGAVQELKSYVVRTEWAQQRRRSFLRGGDAPL